MQTQTSFAELDEYIAKKKQTRREARIYVVQKTSGSQMKASRTLCTTASRATFCH
jgi:hypothetical protein